MTEGPLKSFGFGDEEKMRDVENLPIFLITTVLADACPSKSQNSNDDEEHTSRHSPRVVYDDSESHCNVNLLYAGAADIDIASTNPTCCAALKTMNTNLPNEVDYDNLCEKDPELGDFCWTHVASSIIASQRIAEDLPEDQKNLPILLMSSVLGDKCPCNIDGLHYGVGDPYKNSGTPTDSKYDNSDLTFDVSSQMLNSGIETCELNLSACL